MRYARLVRALIRLYPREFRERYGAAMLDFHSERSTAAPGLLTLLRIVLDHLLSATGERLRPHLARAATADRASLSIFAHDFRFALRSVSRRRVFTAVVVATIALGVGANAAIFSVVHGILLRPLPYPSAERVVSFGHKAPQWLTSPPEFFDYRDNLRSFAGLAAYTKGEANLASDQEPERVVTAVVSEEFFPVMGVSPLLGRPFDANEHVRGPSSVVILSHGLWQRRFAGEPGIIGREITLNGRVRTVIGVMPRNFDYPTARTDIWQPMPRMLADSLGDRANHFLFMVGRLRPGVAPEGAIAEATPFARRMMEQNISRYDPQNPPVPVISAVATDLVGSTRPYLWALLGAVAFVMLIVCANVANLLLARGEGRRREMALRGALGATRVRLITQLLIESLLLALGGGVFGVMIAWTTTRALIVLAPASIPRLDEIGMNWLVLLYAFSISMVAGLLFGLVPAFRGSREAPGETLKKGGRAEPQSGSRRVRQALVVAEVAVAVVMLSGASLLVRSLLNLQSADLGFNTYNAVTAKISLSGGYDDQRAIVFYNALLERVRALPGVEHTGAGGWLPVAGTGGLWGVLAEGQSYDQLVQGPLAVPQQVTTGYFAAMGMPILRGRDFTEQDRMSGPYVTIVSQAMAQQLWPNVDPLGKRFRLGGGTTLMTVVGVVADIRARGFGDTPEPTMYIPYAQTSVSAYFQPRSLSVIVRTAADPAAIGDQLRAIVRSLDPAVPVSDLRTLEQVVGTSIAERRFSTSLITGFALLALVLAGIGIFGVISYGVSERTFEIGVRMALGAKRAGALSLVLSESLGMALLGIIIGVAGSAAVAQTIRSMLVEVPPVHAPTLLAVSAVLMAVVIVATIIPARRAMAVDPTEALRGA